MKSGTWGEAEERRLVFGIVAHEKKEGPLVAGSRRGAGGDQAALWHKISECVPQRCGHWTE
jgi:hypothetical protein